VGVCDCYSLPVPLDQPSDDSASGKPPPDLGAAAKLLARVVGGGWEKDVHAGLPPGEQVLRGAIHAEPGKVLVRYNVFPFGIRDRDRQQWLRRAYRNSTGARTLGGTAHITVVELTSDRPAAARYSQAVIKALELSPLPGASSASKEGR
jgi:hypothetical protein